MVKDQCVTLSAIESCQAEEGRFAAKPIDIRTMMADSAQGDAGQRLYAGQGLKDNLRFDLRTDAGWWGNVLVAHVSCISWHSHKLLLCAVLDLSTAMCTMHCMVHEAHLLAGSVHE